METDGRLPSGEALGDAIRTVDEATGGAPAYYMVNCAHPTHVDSTLLAGNGWAHRVRGLRANASTMSHEELDNAETLDIGNIEDVRRPQRRSAPAAAADQRLRRLLRHRRPPHRRRTARPHDVSGDGPSLVTAREGPSSVILSAARAAAAASSSPIPAPAARAARTKDASLRSVIRS